MIRNTNKFITIQCSFREYPRSSQHSSWWYLAPNNNYYEVFYGNLQNNSAKLLETGTFFKFTCKNKQLNLWKTRLVYKVRGCLGNSELSEKCRKISPGKLYSCSRTSAIGIFWKSTRPRYKNVLISDGWISESLLPLGL